MHHFEEEDEARQESTNFYGEVISYKLRKFIISILNEIEEEFGEEYSQELMNY